MGVVGSVSRVDGAKLRELCEEPRELRWHMVGWEPEPKPVGLLQRMLGGKPESSAPKRPPWQEPPTEDSQYLDKAWHAIHFLLTGSADPDETPRGFLLSGRSVESGDFAVLVHDEKATQRIAEALRDVDRSWLSARWNQSDLARSDVYLIQDCNEDDDEVREYVFDYALELVQFVQVAAQRGCGLIVDIAG